MYGSASTVWLDEPCSKLLIVHTENSVQLQKKKTLLRIRFIRIHFTKLLSLFKMTFLFLHVFSICLSHNIVSSKLWGNCLIYFSLLAILSQFPYEQ